jgi:hypothetical protein
VSISVLASNTAPVAGFGSSITMNTRGWVDAPRTPFVRGATNFTIELWVKNPTLNDGSFHAIIGAETPNSTNSANPLPLRSPSLFLAPINGGLHFDLSSASSNRLGNFVWGFFNSTNAWVHVAWVKDGRTFRFYRNGSIVTNRLAPSDFYIDAGGYSIGRVGRNLWNGAIDGVKIWNIARTDEQVARDMFACVQGTEPGLAASWSFDEGGGNLAFDSSPNRNHGILQSNATYSADAPPLAFVAPAGYRIGGQVPASDLNANTLIFSLSSPPANGSAQVSPDGTFYYASRSGFFGIDSFRYRVFDGLDYSNEATITLVVRPSILGAPPRKPGSNP